MIAIILIAVTFTLVAVTAIPLIGFTFVPFVLLGLGLGIVKLWDMRQDRKDAEAQQRWEEYRANGGV